MKRILIYITALLIPASALHAVDFKHADRLFSAGDKYRECVNELNSMLPEASGNAEKADILWRLSRAWLMLGEQSADKNGKRECFGKGIGYAEEGIKTDRGNRNCYMWHCANTGRECQTHSLMEQASKVPVMIRDLTIILDSLKQTDCSEAWQALAEIYYHHPMKSDDAAISFTRQALTCIPKGEMRLSTYIFLARMLYERNRSAEKRCSGMMSDSKKYHGSHDSVIDRYAFFEGSLGPEHKPAWSSRKLGDMSDREEAEALISHAGRMYEKAAVKNAADDRDYLEIVALKKKWN